MNDSTSSRQWRHVVLGATTAAIVTMAACAADTDRGATGGRTGADVYATSCASCHGSELDGTDMGPPLRSIVYEPGHHPDESFRVAITRGVQPHHFDFGPMPIVGGLDDDDIAAVIAHIRQRQQQDGYLPYP